MIGVRPMLLEALTLAQMLPDDLPVPDVSMDQDCDLTFEWYADKSNLVTIWMFEGRVSYAGMYDGKSSSGRTSERGVIPPQCMTLIRSVVERISPQRPGVDHG